MSTLNFPAHQVPRSNQPFVGDAVAANADIFHVNTPVQKTSEPVVVFFPSGNYNQLTELGRYKTLGVAMAILSSINHPDSAFQIPEYKIFSLDTGAEIFTQ